MSEQGHEGGQAHAGVDEAGSECVAELMQGDPQRTAGWVGERGVGDGGVQTLAEAVLTESATAFAEHEVGEVAVTGMGQRPVRSAVADPLVEQVDGLGVDGNHALGSELADWDTQPTPAGLEVDDAAELEVQQFADPHAGCPQQPDPDASEAVFEPGDGGHQVPVHSRGQGPGHGLGQAGDVTEEQQPLGRRGGPAPFGDVFEEHPQVDDIVVERGQRDGLAGSVGSPPRPGAGPRQERLDVAGAVELVEPDCVGVVVGQPVAQHPDGLDAPETGRGPQCGGDVGGVADDVPADLGLGDVARVLDGGPGRRPGVTGRLVDLALLEAQLPQRCGPLGEPIGCRRGDVDAASLGDGAVEVVVDHGAQGLVEPQAQHRSGVAQHLAGPVRTPPQPGRRHRSRGHLGLVGQVVSGGREPPLYRSLRTVRDSLPSYGSHSPAFFCLGRSVGSSPEGLTSKRP